MKTKKNFFQKYWPICLICLAVFVTTAMAGWQAVEHPEKGLTWVLPLPILALAWLHGTKSLNKPILAIVAMLVCALSTILLFVPLPPGLDWYYPIVAAWLIYLFI